MLSKSKDKWFHADRKLNWHKEDSERTRRKNALNSRHGSLFQTGKALLGLANVSTDAETARKAKSDSTYFFALHKKKLILKGKPVRKQTRRR
jgi:hypothetical protein